MQEISSPQSTLYKCKVIDVFCGYVMVKIYTGYNEVNYLDKQSNVGSDVAFSSNQDVSIFNNENAINAVSAVDDASILALEEQLAAVQAEQGCIMKGWDKLKGSVNLGTSSEKCDEAIEKYKNGEMTFDEAMAEIEKFDTKQSNSLDLFSNIITGVGAVVAATAAAAAVVGTGGAAAPVIAAVAAGAGAGAVAKPLVKVTDKATNDVEKDITGKQVAKDALSGAISGAIAGATMGNGSAVTATGEVAKAGAKASISQSIKTSAINSAKTGLVTGSISGSSGYMLDCAFDENKEFNVGELAVNTATGALVSGAVGGIMGSANGFGKATGILKDGGMVKAATENGKKIIDESTGKFVVENASKEAIAANALCNAEYKVVNRAVRDLGAAVAA